MKLSAYLLLTTLLFAAPPTPRTEPAQEPPPAGEEEQNLDTFIPTEEVPLDSSVSFPVNL